MKETFVLKSRVDNIEVDFFKPESWDEKKIMIFCHGFNSGKQSEAYKIIGEKFLEKGIAYVIFSLPYHAERRGDYNELTLENCVEDSELVEEYIRSRYPETQVGILGTSFGGYLTLLRLHRYKHKYFSIILKSPAIKMDSILKSFMTDNEFEYFKNQGYVINNFKEDGMRINFSFYEELANNLLMDYSYEEEILLYHGTIDDTAPYKDSVDFSNKNKNVILHTFPNENHKFSMEILEQFSEEVSEYSKNK